MEKVKSAWQELRAQRHWTRGKDRVVNTRTRKLYEMLEKVTCEIDRTQKGYMGAKANRYLRKSAARVLVATGKPSLREDAEISRGMIFPKRAGQSRTIGSDVTRLRSVDAIAESQKFDENVLAGKRSTEDLSSSRRGAKERSTRSRIVGDHGESVRTIAPDTRGKKRDTIVDPARPLPFKGEKRTDIRSSIEEYLRRYAIEEKRILERSRASTPDIADILADLDIRSCESLEKCDDADEQDEKHSRMSTATKGTTPPEAVRENWQIRGDTGKPENAESNNDVPRATTAVDASSPGASRRSAIASCEDNAFVRLALSKSLSRDQMSQIFQSKYLRKDLSLY